MLTVLHRRVGNSWAEIKRLLPSGRTENAVKSRWKTLVRARAREEG